MISYDGFYVSLCHLQENAICARLNPDYTLDPRRLKPQVSVLLYITEQYCIKNRHTHTHTHKIILKNGKPNWIW